MKTYRDSRLVLQKKIKKVQAGETCTNFVEQKAEIKVAEGNQCKAAIVCLLNVNCL
jgi:hypothetical protein